MVRRLTAIIITNTMVRRLTSDGTPRRLENKTFAVNETLSIECADYAGWFVQAKSNGSVEKVADSTAKWKVIKVSGSDYDIYLESVVYPAKYLSTSNDPTDGNVRKMKTDGSTGSTEKFSFYIESTEESKVCTNWGTMLAAPLFVASGAQQPREMTHCTSQHRNDANAFLFKIKRD